jgi:hypothetical protein
MMPKGPGAALTGIEGKRERGDPGRPHGRNVDQRDRAANGHDAAAGSGLRRRRHWRQLSFFGLLHVSHDAPISRLSH